MEKWFSFATSLATVPEFVVYEDSHPQLIVTKGMGGEGYSLRVMPYDGELHDSFDECLEKCGIRIDKDETKRRWMNIVGGVEPYCKYICDLYKKIEGTAYKNPS